MSMQRITYLDGWRGLAILFVLLDHFGDIERFSFGSFGVELFFVLSGRLMAELLVVQAIPWRTFLWRRFSRIYPALFVFCTIMLVVSSTRTIYPTYAPPVGWEEYFAAIFFVMNYVFSRLGDPLTLDHTWSLAVEEHSYLLLALIVFAVSRLTLGGQGKGGDTRRPAPMIALAAACLGCVMMLSGLLQSLLTDQNEHVLYWRSDVRAASVLVSFSLYLAIRPLDRLRNGGRLPTWTPTIGFLAAMILNSEMFPVWLRYTLGTLALALSVNTIDFASQSVRSLLSARGITTVGTLSYSLYLWQQPFYKFSDIIGPVAGVAASVAAATGSYILIEKPSRAFLNRLWANRGAASRVNPL